jgi:hypothetical protein
MNKFAAIRVVALLFAAILPLGAANDVSATPVTHRFDTGPAYFTGIPEPLNFWAGGVSGSFTYPEAVGLILAAGDGSTIYNRTMGNLFGSAAGLNFSDPIGRTFVGNDVGPGGPFGGKCGNDVTDELGQHPHCHDIDSGQAVHIAPLQLGEDVAHTPAQNWPCTIALETAIRRNSFFFQKSRTESVSKRRPQ